MKKIKTIFERDWKGNRAVTPEYISELKLGLLDSNDAVATEKVDGSNVRVTIRNGVAVRLEKRRNPDKLQKHKGIKEPWYKDADEYSPEDKWFFDALKNSLTCSLGEPAFLAVNIRFSRAFSF